MLFRSNKYFNPVAFIDDNIDLQGTILAGVPVLSYDDLVHSSRRLSLDLVLLAMPSSSNSNFQKKISKRRCIYQ